MIFFTADNHFFHELAAQNRGFKNADIMNEEMIKIWNSTVLETDHVYILGDFAMDRKGEKIKNLLARLNGSKTLILGNHDHWANEKILPDTHKLFHEVCTYKEIKYKKIKFILFHYPICEWNFKRFKSIHLHGHQHTRQYDVDYMLNVSVDQLEYKPIAIDEVLSRLGNMMNTPCNENSDEISEFH